MKLGRTKVVVHPTTGLALYIKKSVVVGVNRARVEVLSADNAKECFKDSMPVEHAVHLVAGHARALGCSEEAAEILNRIGGYGLEGSERPKPKPKKVKKKKAKVVRKKVLKKAVKPKGRK